jgi:hypothetical protein
MVTPGKPDSLLKSEWATIDLTELLILCRDRIPPGQFDSAADKNTIYFPSARDSCEFAIKIEAGRVLEIKGLSHCEADHKP